jgi:nitrate reductase NapE component
MDALKVWAPGRALRLPATVISYLFHPVFIPLFATAFLVFIHPGYFAGFSLQHKNQVMLIVLLNTVLFPLLSIGLLKALGFIQSIFLRTQRDRIIPYIACGIFYFWTYIVFRKQEAFDPIVASFMLGVFLASSAGLLANIYFKVSLHAIGMGGWLGLFIIISRTNTMLMTWPLAVIIFITGLVCTSRLILTDHSQKEIYSGLAIGLVTQWIAAMVLL